MEFEILNKFWSLIHEKVESWIEAGIRHLPNMVVAIVIVFVFAIFARIAAKLMSRALHRVFHSTQIADLLTAIFKVIVFVAGVFIALEFLGLTGTVTSLLAGAGIIGLAIGFAFQDMTENLIAGIAMGIRKPFEIEDVIEADGVFGNVKSINLRNTIVQTFSGQIEVIPNKILFRNIVTNYTTIGERKIEIPVGISYADDVMKASEVLCEALRAEEYVIRKDDVSVYASGFGDSSVNLLVWFWINYPGETGFMDARHKAVHLVHQTLTKSDILIPFPIRTLDFDAKGGQKLNAMLATNNTDHQNNKSEAKSSSIDDANVSNVKKDGNGSDGQQSNSVGEEEGG